jgi:hypothetical protein
MVGGTYDDEATFREVAAGSDGRGGGGRAVARHCCGHGAVARRGGDDGGDTAGAGSPRCIPGVRVGSFGEPAHAGSRGGGGCC